MKETQKDKVLAWLLGGYSITPQIAVQMFNCWRLSSVINRLRNEGHTIETEKKGKAGQATYTLKFKDDLFD